MQDVRTPSTPNPSHLVRLRTWARWAVAALATLLTVLTAVGARSASTQVHDKDADIGWFVAAALIAIALWVAALILSRMCARHRQVGARLCMDLVDGVVEASLTRRAVCRASVRLLITALSVGSGYLGLTHNRRRRP